MKIKILSIILFSLLFISCSGPLKAPTTNELLEPIHYELDTWGSNSEIYEFNPKWDKETLCIVYILDNLQSSNLQCFKL